MQGVNYIKYYDQYFILALIIDSMCNKIFKEPFNLAEKDVLDTVRQADHCQKTTIVDLQFHLCIKRYSSFYLLVLGNESGRDFIIREVYKIFEDLIQSKEIKRLNLLSVLSELYGLIGFEFDLGGKKSKFIFNHCCIGIPKIPHWNDHLILNEFWLKPEMQALSNFETFCLPHFRIIKGNFIDFIDVFLIYIFHPKKYGDYLNSNSM
jgi:hypothetical protein